MHRRTPFLLLLSVLLLPAPSWAQEEGDKAAEVAVPSGEKCRYPVDLLWKKRPDEEGQSHRMGVSVTNKANGQQVPGLSEKHFRVFLDGVEVEKNETFKIQQSKDAFEQVAASGGDGGAVGVDPVNYDVYFVVDLTESMSSPLDVGGKKRSRLNLSLNLINSMVQAKKGDSLFDQNDRLYVSGFTSRIETSFMGAATADRGRLNEALLKINEFKPQGRSAALYAAIDHNLNIVGKQAALYTSDKDKREAVVIVLTDSFNGMDLSGRRKLRYCRENAPLTDELRKKMLAVQKATRGSLKLYVLGVGEVGDTDRYKVEGDSNKWCKIASTESKVLDAKSFKLLGERRLTRGGFQASTQPVQLLNFVKAQFENLKKAYEIAYIPPEGAGKAKEFKVRVAMGKHLCEAIDHVQANIIPQAYAKNVETSPSEAAMFLAGLVIALFFLPRTFTNLGSLGGGSGGRRSKSSKKRKKGKKKRRR